MVDLAYVPTSSGNFAKEIIAPTKIDTPNYPDQGIAFAGFSKTLYSGNEYRLNPQSEDDQSFLFHYVAPTGLSTIPNPWGGKDFYCTKIILQTYVAGAMIAGDYVIVADGSVTRCAMFEDPLRPINTYNLDFNTPLKFTKGNNIQIVYTGDRAAGDYTILNLFGWTE